MSAGRYEIFDDGPCIRIVSPDSTISTIVGRPVGYHIDDAVIGAIRQQARDIKLLTQMLHDQRLVIDDLEHRRVEVCDENDKLRTDLAAAVALTAARDETIAELELRLRISRQSNKELREAAEQAEARLSAIDVAPTVARVVEIKRDFTSGPYRCLDYDSDKLPGGFVELIARPAKD